MIESTRHGTSKTVSTFNQSSWLTRSTLLIAAAASLLALPSLAQACSCLPCDLNRFFVGTNAVPSTLPGIYWGGLPDSEVSDSSSIQLYKITDGGEELVEIEVSSAGDNLFLVTPKAGFATHTHYVARSANTCDANAPAVETTFMTGDAAPLPSEFGALIANPNQLGTVHVASGGSCIGPLDASKVDVTWNLAPQLEVWREYLIFDTIVDENSWSPQLNVCPLPTLGSTSNWQGADVLFSGCGPQSDDVFEFGLAQGAHTVSMTARLPGHATTWQSETVTVHLDCGDTTDTTGTSTTGSTATDSTTGDSTSLPSDTTSTSTDSTSSASTGSSSATDSTAGSTHENTSTHAEDDDSQDTGCRLMATPTNRMWSVLGIVAFAMLRRRAKR